MAVFSIEVTASLKGANLEDSLFLDSGGSFIVEEVESPKVLFLFLTVPGPTL